MEDVVDMAVHEWASHKTGSDLIADFIAARCFARVFVVNGGACAFMIDALGRHADTDYVCVQHEQAAAMAADAIWRTTQKVGVTMATSGPGATNLITGIAGSWFDSIPTLHITGQVNDRESKVTVGADVRQAGFQETDIVAMVSTITKSATKVSTTAQLALALRDALSIATSGRMGPVLIDVPMNVQQEPVMERDYEVAFGEASAAVSSDANTGDLARSLSAFLAPAERPLVILGGGLGLAGTTPLVQAWCDAHEIPYIASWAGLTYVDRSRPGYHGSQGVYGSRHANWAVQAADRIVSFGSRLDNRQRTGNPRAYAPFADLFVIDVDPEEVRKFSANPRYSGEAFDLKAIEPVLEALAFTYEPAPWAESLERDRVTNESGWATAVGAGELNPYDAVPAMQAHFAEGTVVASDTGANLCWLFQAYGADDSLLFTSGGHSPMGYALPAAIGAQVARPDAPVVCAIGDGGMQMNIQELQTAVAYELPITILLFNNAGYGIIKQFQDSNTMSRYHASGHGYSAPDFGKIAHAYGIPYHRIDSIDQIKPSLFDRSLKLVELVIPPQALITPKAEGDHFLHDQAPRIPGRPQEPLPFDYPERPSDLNVSSAL